MRARIAAILGASIFFRLTVCYAQAPAAPPPAQAAAGAPRGPAGNAPAITSEQLDLAAKLASITGQNTAEVVKKAQDDAADAKEKAATATAAAKSATKEATTANGNLDELKSGKLIRYGITGGLALAIQTPLTGGDSAQLATAFTTMPYLLLVPAYWGMPEATRMYCASNWGSGNEDDAQSAAKSIAKKAALRKYDAIVADLIGAGIDAHGGTTLAAEQLKAIYLPIAKRYEVVTAVVMNVDGKDKEVEQPDPAPIDFVRRSLQDASLKDYAVDGLANHIWNPTKAGRCGWTKLGLWVGIPLAYSTTTRLRESDGTLVESSRQMGTKAAFGLSFTPNAYFSVLFGVTVATLTQKTIPATTGGGTTGGLDQTSWAGTVAIGGNLDLLGLLVNTK